jgi:hypothetical protein
MLCGLIFAYVTCSMHGACGGQASCWHD